LSATLLAKVRDTFQDDQRDIAAILCEERAEVAIDDVLRPATKACLSRLDAQSDEFRTIWEAAKQILCRICPFGVRRAWIARQGQKVAGSIEFRIMVKTPTGVEVAAARFNQVAASFHSEPGKSEVRGQGAIRTPRFEPGWGLDAAVMVILIEIWNRVFSLDERRTLTEDDLELLNAKLLDVVKHGEGQYYISVQTGVARRVEDRQMLHLIKMWIEAPVEETDERGRKRRTTRNRDGQRGVPQGSPITP
jgi:hypothetical protein